MRITFCAGSALCLGFVSVTAQSAEVLKTNALPVYAHYMPWFETPQTLGDGNWGLHWEMNTADPNLINPDGTRQIASHYYPTIGPYASSDPHVIEYHLLLMKYAGIDGVIIDWYGTQGTNPDIDRLLINSNALIDRVDDFGLSFAVVLEDRFAASTQDVAANVGYIGENISPINATSAIRTTTALSCRSSARLPKKTPMPGTPSLPAPEKSTICLRCKDNPMRWPPTDRVSLPGHSRMHGAMTTSTFSRIATSMMPPTSTNTAAWPTRVLTTTTKKAGSKAL